MVLGIILLLYSVVSLSTFLYGPKDFSKNIAQINPLHAPCLELKSRQAKLAGEESGAFNSLRDQLKNVG